MFTTLTKDLIETTLSNPSRPLLLAYVKQNFDYKDQLEVLEDISASFSRALDICLLDDSIARAFCEANQIAGSPTFLFYRNGHETGRLLGKINRNELETFIRANLHQ